MLYRIAFVAALACGVSAHPANPQVTNAPRAMDFARRQDGGSSVLKAPMTIAAGESFDGGNAIFDRGVSCTGQAEGGDSDAVFILEKGASLSNVRIGPNQIEGVHCMGGCTLTNVVWDAVCEDAFTIKKQEAGETTTINGGSAKDAEDKVIQHNGGGTVVINDFTVSNFGKLYRSCGNCKEMPARHVKISGGSATDGKLLVGINENMGDTASISGITSSGVKEECTNFKGTTPGNEPTKVGACSNTGGGSSSGGDGEAAPSSPAADEPSATATPSGSGDDSETPTTTAKPSKTKSAKPAKSSKASKTKSAKASKPSKTKAPKNSDDETEAQSDDDGEEHFFDKAPGDPNAYSTGSVGRHNVVLAYMPGEGKASAAIVAAQARASYPNIKLALVVGICGAVPLASSLANEIVLGDVIVSNGIVQYDLGRRLPEHFVRKNTLTETLGRPNMEIRALLGKLEGRRSRVTMNTKIIQYLAELQKKPDLQAQYPGAVHDKLFKVTYRYLGSYGETCAESGCDGEVIRRHRLEQAVIQPLVHIGLVASGDTVMMSGEERDKIAKQEKVIGFEMESAGVWDTFPCIVIKGVCDYADSHKTKAWQSYAAATAAACGKAFLEFWLPANIQQAPRPPATHTGAHSQDGLERPEEIKATTTSHATNLYENQQETTWNEVGTPMAYQGPWATLVHGNEPNDPLQQIRQAAQESFLLGCELFMQRKYSAAREQYQQAIRRQKQSLGEYHEDTLISIFCLGKTLKSEGRYSEARQQFEQAIEGQIRVLGKYHEFTLMSIHSLGCVLSEEEDYSAAML
ncbi:Pectate lyase E [Paramyrothecium foliicola]|nr:Pectate lyase E [Paramyrothecium foliicola]